MKVQKQGVKAERCVPHSKANVAEGEGANRDDDVGAGVKPRRGCVTRGSRELKAGSADKQDKSKSSRHFGDKGHRTTRLRGITGHDRKEETIIHAILISESVIY